MNKNSLGVFEDVVIPKRSFEPPQRGQISDGHRVHVRVVGANCFQVSQEQVTVGTPLSLYERNRYFEYSLVC